MEIRQAISMYLTAKAYNDTEFKNYHKQIVNLVNANMEEIRKRNINHNKMKIAV